MRRFLTLACIALFCAGCGGAPRSAARVPLTERQRDSVIARSRLPGGTVVGRALSVSDQAASQAARTDAAVDSLFH